MTSNKHPELLYLKIQGMHCANCALAVERALAADGAAEVSVSFTDGVARITGSSPSDAEKFLQTIRRLGYSAREDTEKDSDTPTSRWSWLEFKALVCALLTLPMLIGMFFPHSHIHAPSVQLALSTPVFVIGFAHFIPSGLRSLRSGIANMDLLVSISLLAGVTSSLAAFFLKLGHEYFFFEACSSIVTFVLVGNSVEKHAVRAAVSSISSLSKLRNPMARLVDPVSLERENVTLIPSKLAQVGQNFLVNAGERIPVDGVIEQGTCWVDTSILTGEANPRQLQPGDDVTAGMLMIDGSVTITATRVGTDTTLAEIERLVHEAQHHKPRLQRIGDSVSAVFVPGVVGFATIFFVVGTMWLELSVSEAILRTLAILVIACPCAMGLATPIAVIAAIGRGAKSGLLFRGGDSIEKLAAIDTVAFDKTGTLTTGSFALVSIDHVSNTETIDLPSLVWSLERHSSHPIAHALVTALAAQNPNSIELSEIRELRGIGVTAKLPDGRAVSIGRSSETVEESRLLRLDVIVDGAIAGRISLADEYRRGAQEALVKLQKDLKLSLVMISGDAKYRVDEAARDLGIGNSHSEQHPHEKLEIIRSLQTNHRVAFVGDGVNDAPALAQSNVGVALQSGTDVAIDSAQLVLMGGRIDRLPLAIKLARKTVRIIRQNYAWAFGYNALMIPLAAAGEFSPLVAALLMTVSDIVVVGNSLRLSKAESDLS
jgi:Cu+-exporting ATPase